MTWKRRVAWNVGRPERKVEALRRWSSDRTGRAHRNRKCACARDDRASLQRLISLPSSALRSNQPLRNSLPNPPSRQPRRPRGRRGGARYTHTRPNVAPAYSAYTRATPVYLELSAQSTNSLGWDQLISRMGPGPRRFDFAVTA